MRTSTNRLGFTFLVAVGLFAAGVAATAALAAPPPTEPASTPPVASPPAAPAAPGAPAGSGTTTESVTGSGAPSASPSGSASADPQSLLPVLRGADIPTTTSDKPKEAEWKEGRKVRPQRGGQGCDLVVVREWLRVTCKDPAGLGLIAGDPKGVTLWTGGSIFGSGGGSTLALVQFPLARGTSRVFSFTDVSGDWDWVGLGEGGTMSVTWRDGEPDPVIGIYRTGELDK
jgi:hypothetical protein